MVRRAATRAVAAGQEWKAVVLSAVPGMGHLWQGQRRRGVYIALCYALLMFFGVVFYGYFLCNLCFGLAIGLHAFAVYDVLPDDANDERPSRLLAVGVYALMLFAIYIPLYQAVTSVVEGFAVGFDTGSEIVQNGDVLLVDKRDAALSHLRRGDIVLFETREQPMGYGMFAGGRTLDRIIGLPGDLVETVGGRLMVNGRPLPAERLPLNTGFALDGVSARVPRDKLLIIPSMLNVQVHGHGYVQVDVNALIRAQILVPVTQVVGRAFMIYKPFTHMGALP